MNRQHHKVGRHGALALCMALALGAQAAVLGDEIAHTVQPGDTLEGLARQYLAAPNQWPLLQQRNKVANPRHLQPGTLLWIPVHLMPDAPARVQFVHGPATAQARGASAPAPVAQGAQLEEGTALHTGPEAFVTIELADGSVVRVQAQSQLELRQLRRRGRAGSVQSVLELQGGAVQTTVPPRSEPLRRLEIRTPRAVTSVRGTQFDVALDGAGRSVAAVLEGTVAVQQRLAEAPPPGAAVALLVPGQGLAVAADGTVGAPRPLLAAPDVAGLPATWESADLVALDLPASPGAIGYVAQLARDADLTQVLRHGRFADGRLRWQTPDDGAYYLAVRAIDSEGIPGQPAVRALTIKARPVPPLYQQPQAGAVLATGTGALRCTQVPGVRWYRLQVAADAQFTQLLQDAQRQEECALSVAALPAGHYFWRAASLRELPGGQADQGPFAAPQPFTLAPAPAALAADALQAQNGEDIVRLRWSGQPGQRYRLQLADSAAFDPIAVDVLLDAPEWTASDLATGSYQVRIQVQDASGLHSAFSAPRMLQVVTGLRTSGGQAVHSASGMPVGRP